MFHAQRTLFGTRTFRQLVFVCRESYWSQTFRYSSPFAGCFTPNGHFSGPGHFGSLSSCAENLIGHKHSDTPLHSQDVSRPTDTFRDPDISAACLRVQRILL